jgi:LCP family protein required for cell wall assembly
MGIKAKMRTAINRRMRKHDWGTWAIAIAFFIFALVAGYLVFNFVRGLVVGWTGEGPKAFGFTGMGTQANTPLPGETALPIVMDEKPLAWDGNERVTILIMGLDYRDWEKGEGPPRTDTMMLLTVDPITKTAGMLSIPRDLWVEIPGFEHNRINTAYFLGESERLPGGGPALAMKTVENFIGVPVQYYAVIEFSAFERLIDEIGGVDVLVKQPVKISPIGRTSQWLEAKPYHLDGAEALAYARARKTEGGDFDRAERQQQVALAIRDRVMGFDMIPKLVAKAPILYEEVKAGIRTNLIDANAPPEQMIQQLQRVISLGLLAMEIDPTTIKKGVISPPEMVVLATLPTGAEVLKPVPEKIRQLRDEIFTMYSAISPSISANDPAYAAIVEAASIEVLNGAGIEGLAGKTAQYLEGLGLNVVEVGNADRLNYDKTVVIDHTGNPYTRQFLLDLAGLTESQILSQYDPNSPIDITLIIGADWSLP